MDSTNLLQCPTCKKWFKNQRALSQHFIQTCQHIPNTKNRNRTKNTSRSKSSNLFLLKNTKPSPKRPRLNEMLDVDKGSPEVSQSNNHLNTSQTDHNHSSTDCIYSSNEDLIQQQSSYNAKSAQLMKDKHLLAEIDLLKILSDLNCHNSAYEKVMNWAKFWNSKDIYFSNSSFYTFYHREVVIRKLSKRYDMEQMKPKNTILNISSNSSIKQEISVTSFDFQQQVLSILRDKELMSPSNLVLDSDPGMTPVFNQDTISEINHSDWYQCAYKHFIKLNGPNPNRVIAGVILAIDKTHTDAKGKLCLESVNFTLSIFNTETRRNNPRAWRSLGFINDLATKYGSGILETSVSHGESTSATDYDVSNF